VHHHQRYYASEIRLAYVIASSAQRGEVIIVWHFHEMRA
jgi:hypothetical protein